MTQQCSLDDIVRSYTIQRDEQYHTFMQPGQEADSLIVTPSDVGVHEDELAHSEGCSIWGNANDTPDCTRTDDKRSGHRIGPPTTIDLSGIRQNTSDTDTYNCTPRSTLRHRHGLHSRIFSNGREDQGAVCFGQFRRTHGWQSTSIRSGQSVFRSLIDEGALVVSTRYLYTFCHHMIVASLPCKYH